MGKYIDCHNCKNQYDCERTYLGGCTDGEEWENETEKAFVEGWETRKAELKDKKEKVIKIIKNCIGGLPECITKHIADELIKSGLIAFGKDINVHSKTEEKQEKVAELQKQVDELKERNYWVQSNHEYECEKSYFEGVEKGNKDTAKEILKEYGYLLSKRAKDELKERYGVEVE